MPVRNCHKLVRMRITSAHMDGKNGLKHLKAWAVFTKSMITFAVKDRDLIVNAGEILPIFLGFFITGAKLCLHLSLKASSNTFLRFQSINRSRSFLANCRVPTDWSLLTADL